MRIVIKQKLRPFSHRFGVRCLIPYTTWEAQVFPAKAFLRDLCSDKKVEIDLPFGGAFEGFTVLQDLERGRIEVFSKKKKRVYLEPDSHPMLQSVPLEPSSRRLSLGVHKKQDWEGIAKRGDLAEIFPFWLRLAEVIPHHPLPKKSVGTMHLLDEGNFEHFFQAGFVGMLSPRLIDENYLGLLEEEKIPDTVSPIGLIHLGAKQIESLFFCQKGEQIHLLPALPPAFHAGRFVHLRTDAGDRIDIEWSKKTLKKVVIYPAKQRAVHMHLQKKLKTFRIRTDLRKRGVVHPVQEPLALEPHKVLYCDRFSH